MDRLPGRPDPIHPPRRTVWVGRAGVHSTMRVEPAGVRAILTMLTRLTTLAMLALLILDLLTTPTTLTALTILAVLTVLGPTIGSRQLSMPNPNPDPGQISMQFGFRNRTIHACPRQCALLHANFRPLKCAAACPALAAACCLRALARYPPPHPHTHTHPPTSPLLTLPPPQVRRRGNAGQPQLHHMECLLAALCQAGERDTRTQRAQGMRRDGEVERVPESG